MPQPRKHASAAARQSAYRRRLGASRQAALAAKGLPPLPAIASMPGRARWDASLTNARDLIATTLTEMQEYFDDRSDPWQASDRGAEHEERMTDVENVLDALQELLV
jgi:hypothetical protein